MAVQSTVTTVVLDDLTGAKNAQTVTFAFDGVSYEIDLTEHNKKRFAKALAPFVEKARTSPPRRATTMGPRKNVSRSNVRDWARSNGFTVSDKGRIPFAILDAFAAAQVADVKIPATADSMITDWLVG